ncbi:PAS domain-containing protein [Natrinema halophilum]|uniref:histidine kinase n=1 Tax=Natrinema halophilum TaxID=1699371 RepID=A0A7D5GG70_9EURY|nr:PAS domain-containing protein [Natrinema halophilum]QLG48107.1 PAS domain-containing protein [Natrinema halophilum]
MFDSDIPGEPESILDRFVDTLPGLAYRCDPEPPWEMMFLKGQVETLTGYPSAAFERGEITYGNLVEQDDREALTQDVMEGIGAQRQFSVSYRIKTRSGDTKHVFERGVPVVDDGEVKALEGIIIDITQQKAYEQRLKRQNDLFAHTQKMAAVGGWEIDPRTDDLRWTDQVNRIHGLPIDESPSIEDAIDFYHPEDQPIIRQAVDGAIHDGEPFEHELRIITRHDEQRWVRTKGVPRLEDGEVVRIRGAIQDITDRRKREQSLRDEQAFTKSIFEALPDLLYTFDEEGSFTRWNDQFRRATGYTDEEIAEMGPLDFIAEQDRGRVRKHIEKVLVGDETTTVEGRLKTKNGDLIPYEFTGAPMMDEEGTLTELVGVGRDISGRIERQRQFEAVFNNTYQFTGLLNLDGTIMEPNEAGLSFANADRQEAIGTKLWEVLDLRTDEGRESVRQGVEKAKAGGSYQDELRVQDTDKEAVIDFSIRPITDADGEINLLVAEGTDITGLKDRERLLRVLHRLLRHNIRNDLTVIRGYSDTLQETLSDEKLIEYADRVDDAAENLLTTTEKAKQMVDVILDHAGDTNLDLGAVVKSVAEQLQERYPAASVDVSIEDTVVVTSDIWVETVFEQFIENGIEHNTASSPRVEVRVFERNGEGCVEIADNGSGISEDEWLMVDEEVRDEPSQLQHGSGIGLLLAQWSVHKFGGSLQHRKRDGGGSVVTVRFPFD